MSGIYFNTFHFYQDVKLSLLLLLLIHSLFWSTRHNGGDRLITGIGAAYAAEEELQETFFNDINNNTLITNNDNNGGELPQLALLQFMVSVDYELKEWYEDKCMPHNEWRKSITAVTLFHDNWDGNLVYLHTSCPGTISKSTFPVLNNQSIFPEQEPVVGGYKNNGLLRRVALVSRGGHCTWSTKVSHAQKIIKSYNMTLAGIIIHDKIEYSLKKEEKPTVNIENWPENDISSNQQQRQQLIPPILFVNQTIGQLLLQSLIYASDNDISTLSKVSVFYEKLPISIGTNNNEDNRLLEQKNESTDRFILAGQLIVNSVAVILVIILIIYACHRFRRRRQLLATRRIMLNNHHDHQQQRYADNTSTMTNTSLTNSETSSFFAVMRRHHGSPITEVNQGMQLQEEEEAGINCQQLEMFPKIYYDPLTIRNSTCAICLDDFRVVRNEKDDTNYTTMTIATKTMGENSNIKLLRRLNCGHGFCVPCIDPWLSYKSRNCPLCKQDCTRHYEITIKPEIIHQHHRYSTTSPPDPDNNTQQWTSISYLEDNHHHRQ